LIWFEINDENIFFKKMRYYIIVFAPKSMIILKIKIVPIIQHKPVKFLCFFFYLNERHNTKENVYFIFLHKKRNETNNKHCSKKYVYKIFRHKNTHLIVVIKLSEMHIRKWLVVGRFPYKTLPYWPSRPKRVSFGRNDATFLFLWQIYKRQFHHP
jgi:hypothetical protein